jgi:hypothetical protein
VHIEFYQMETRLWLAEPRLVRLWIVEWSRGTGKLPKA